MEDEPQMTIEAYHDDTSHLNFSALEYSGEWIKGEFIPTPERLRAYRDGLLYAKTSRSAEVGTAIHALFEGKKISDVMLIGPGDNRAKKEWKEWVKTLDPNETRQLFKQSEVQLIIDMYDSVSRHPQVARLAGLGGSVERTIKAVDKQTGLKIKCRPDLLIQSHGIFVDYKSTQDPSPVIWLKHAGYMGYPRQSEFYKNVMRNYGIGELDPVHIVVGTEKPHFVCVYRFHPDDLAEAAQQNALMMRHVMTWEEYDMWEPSWANEIVCQRIPNYRGGM